MPENVAGYVTVQEAAQKLERSTEQVRRYLREGKLDGRRIGGQWFIREEAVLYRTHPGGSAVAPREFSYLDRVYNNAGTERRREIFERISRRREEIRARWERECIGMDAAELVRELRDEEP
jgi:excisionase family DNA binding protein